jgi:CRP-like cAMP-binding protein
VSRVGCKACENPCALYDLIQDGLELRNLIKPIEYKKEDLVYQEGTPTSGCYIICKGKVKLVKRALSGKKQLLKFFGPGEIIGKVDLFNRESYSVYARTLEESRLAFINKESFLNLIRDHPLTVLEITKDLSKEINALRERLITTSYGSVRERLIYILLSFEERHSYDKESGSLIVDLTQSELAEFAGVARETVSRQLGELKAKGLISFEDHRIVIPDVKELRALL